MKDDTKELTLFDNYDFIEKIESLMADCESAEVEFKSARGGFPGSLWETYSAFANTQGGVIVLGVKEKDGKFTLDGITLEQARKYKKETHRYRLVFLIPPDTNSRPKSDHLQPRAADIHSYISVLFIICKEVRNSCML